MTDLRIDWHDAPAGEPADLPAVWLPQREDYITRAPDPSIPRATEYPMTIDAKHAAGVLAASMWVGGVGARLAFAVAAGNGAGPAIARFSVAHHITGSSAWIAALVMMALATCSPGEPLSRRLPVTPRLRGWPVIVATLRSG